jgi:hypothetical protein
VGTQRGWWGFSEEGGWGGEDGLGARMVSDTRMVMRQGWLVTRMVSDEDG